MLKSWRNHYWFSVPVVRGRIEEVVRAVGPDKKRVLECGCNEGFLSSALIEAGHNVTSIDKDQKQLDKAKGFFGIEGKIGDVNELSFGDKEFDVVIGGELLEHVENPFKALGEMFRVARDRVIITLPVGEYWLGELTHQWGLEAAFVDHDSGSISRLEKNALVLCWDRKRDDRLNDIPPFSTIDLKRKYGI